MNKSTPRDAVAPQSPGITFALGPLGVRIEGEHPVTQWAQTALATVAEPAERRPDVTFTFRPDRPCLGDGPWFGDSEGAAAAGRQFIEEKHFEILLDRRDSATRVLLGNRSARKKRTSAVRYPDLAFKTMLQHGCGLGIHPLKSFAYNVAPTILQIALLDRSAAILHASCIERDGSALLLTARGGVGKTALCLGSILAGHGRFLADDHAVIDAEGRAHLYPLPIHIYGYHFRHIPGIEERMLRQYPPFNRLLWHTAGRLRGLSKTVRWVSPAAVVGEDRMARSGRLEQVVLMFRREGGPFEWRDSPPQEAARNCLNVILNEMRNISAWLALGGTGPFTGAMGEITEVLPRLQSVYERAFSRARCATLFVPAGANAADLRAFVREREPRMGKFLG